MSTQRDPETQRLLHFSIDVLEQALGLVASHELPGALSYAAPVGAHLRHVIEHCEALLCPAEIGIVDYDQRPRDRELERQPTLARARLEALLARLLQWTDAQLDAPLQVRGLGGLTGDFDFAMNSSAGRELVFVASHAIHHYALLQAHCKQHGIPINAQIGRAPATVAHECAALSTSAMPSSKEIPVNAPVADLPVRSVLGGLHFIADLTLPYGRVLHDYKAKAATRGATEVAGGAR